ncbi:hypothetical protein [Desulfosoma caldarium]|uniref:Uncharacterized protein n=1 Tax=Desulfosoma caldarium TaxID=610254 RepID=A0A3N1VTN7_9BACT|nr:hypothetical protein [Desulfosoma caldarium]ROR03157.1 hypothetical protein EDC27_0415 [Desulfosoma caldarium]
MNANLTNAKKSEKLSFSTMGTLSNVSVNATQVGAATLALNQGAGSDTLYLCNLTTSVSGMPRMTMTGASGTRAPATINTSATPAFGDIYMIWAMRFCIRRSSSVQGAAFYGRRWTHARVKRTT